VNKVAEHDVTTGAGATVETFWGKNVSDMGLSRFLKLNGPLEHTDVLEERTAPNCGKICIKVHGRMQICTQLEEERATFLYKQCAPVVTCDGTCNVKVTPHSDHRRYLCVSCEVRTVSVCSVRSSQQTATVSPHSINRLGSVVEK
jgi:hypothetical protein